ncbi:MAG: M48 family metalloprotease [Nitrospirota bacterium]|nr:MAG: M48 family metalloprotease [Nitrospirota bacterium]
MNCPNCKEQALRPVLTRQGTEIDYCDKCKGVWLDKGEIFQFARKPKLVSRKLNEGFKKKRQGNKLSPRSGKPMIEFRYPGGPLIDYDTESGGLWFDAGELRALLNSEANMKMNLDRATVGSSGKAGMSDNLKRRERLQAGKLLPLPNMFMRSMYTLFGLYALLGAILIAAVEFLDMPVEFAVGFGLIVMMIQFIIGPFLMDLSLRCFYKMEWMDRSELPEDLQRFVKQLCAENKMKFPRFGVIDDGAPQAFTYGHTPGNARIVVSRGLFELLDPEESQAVIAHEIGHAVHWDMLLMTIAQMVPLLLYYVYRTLVRMDTSDSENKGNQAKVVVAIGAYVLYIVSEYIVLWFSRTREYHADRFAGEATGDPSKLASALVKIAYGLAGQEKKKDKTEESSGSRSANLEAIGAMGIFDGKAARAFAVAGFNEGVMASGEVDKENVKSAMRWDLWNPWAKWYELNSTHPLVANRLMYMSNLATHMGKEPYIVFDHRRPESYWDEFFVDIIIHLLPLLSIAGVVGVFFLMRGAEAFPSQLTQMVPYLIAFLGAAMMIRFRFSYKGGYFPKMSVASLLKKVKVSSVRPVPCTLKGKIIGRGVPGYIFSEDFVMKDDTGIIFLDYRQPFALWELLFGLLKAGEYQGREVAVEGWYRRSPVPYVEVKAIYSAGELNRSWVPALYKFTAVVLFLIGAGWALLSFFGPKLGLL